MIRTNNVIPSRLLLAGILAGCISVLPLGAQSPSRAGKAPVAAAHSHYRPSRFPKRATVYYEQIWGVDSLSVKAVESGEIIRFAYRVLDANRAQALNDKKAEPSLIAPRARVSLVVPALEKVGKLRQSPRRPRAGLTGWLFRTKAGS